MDAGRRFGRYLNNRWQQSSRLTKGCLIGSVAAVAAPFAIIPVLGAVGFTSAGVAAGSLAASMQTAATVSGSLFALCQSAGATGVVATSTSLIVGAVAGTTVGGVTAAVAGNNSPHPQNDEDGANGENNEDVVSENVGDEEEELPEDQYNDHPSDSVELPGPIENLIALP